jgi:ligand-binding sensor domain-containing protein
LRKYFLIALSLITFVELFSQSSGFIFHNIGERQGLSFNYSYRILKDSHGLLWIGTVNGLSRFDGNHFYNFKSGSDTHSFINNEIIDLCEDKDGNIWGGAASGIFCYQVKKNKFINYIPPTFDFARRVKNILCDRKGDIWATTEWNIVKFNKQKKAFEEIGPLTRNTDSLGDYSVRQNGLVEDPSGKGLWFATRRGLHFYNTAENKFYNYKNQRGDSLFTNHSVAALSLAPGGYFWFFDNVTKKIIAFDPATHKILHQVYVGLEMPDTNGQTVFEDSNHRLWVSTWNNKMAVIDYTKNNITVIAYKNDNPLSIAGDSFWDVWEDEDKNIWLATAGGISKCNYSKNIYSIIPIVEKMPEIKNGWLGGFSIDPRDKSWWLAVEGHIAVVHYYPESGKYHYFDFSNSEKNMAGQLAGPVFKVGFMDGQPYAFTHTGIWRINEKTKQLIPSEKKFEDWPYIPYTYFVEHGNDVWFSTKEGFIKWNKISNHAIKIKSSVDSLPDGQRPVYGMVFFDKTERPWFVPAFGWLGYINEKNEVILKYYIKNKAKELSGYLTSMADDKKGNLWMAAAGVGLYKYDTHKYEMHLYSQSNEITSFARQAMPDRDGRIWIVAMNKFSVYNPTTNSISHYNLPVYENTLSYGNSLLQDSEGAMLATVYKDVVKFMPERLHLKPVIKEPLLSMIKISGKDKLIVDETKLNLEPDQNSLEFNFGSLINAQIFPYSFEYKLDGFDKKWVTANNGAAALYNNLNPGKYTFRVKTVAKDRSWQSSERVITLSIRTPFYKAFWFWLIIGALLAGALVFFYRFRMQKQKQILTLKTKAQELEKEKTMVMYESLKQQLNPHFLFNSLTSLSGLIETDQQVAGDFLEQMSGIYRYILKNGDNETVSLKDEIEFVQLYINLQQTRFKKGLQVNVDVPDEYLHYKIPPVTLQNLIENAIKHNIIDIANPLVIDIFVEGDYLAVRNNLQKKNVVETSNKKGLIQFISLYRYLSDQPVVIEETEKEFLIKIPLI